MSKIRFCEEIGCLRKVLSPSIYCDKHQDKSSTPREQLFTQSELNHAVEEARKQAYNYARYVVHSILSDDVDRELTHAEIEEKFVAGLAQPPLNTKDKK